MCITKIHVDLIHKNTIMSDEHNVSSQSSMQCLPTWLPIIILWRAEEQLPLVREVMVGAVCLCADKTIISSYSGYFYGSKVFLGSCATFQGSPHTV